MPPILTLSHPIFFKRKELSIKEILAFLHQSHRTGSFIPFYAALNSFQPFFLNIDHEDSATTSQKYLIISMYSLEEDDDKVMSTDLSLLTN